MWSDSSGNFKLTIKGVRDNDYFDGTAKDEVWKVLKFTNDVRDAQGKSLLTFSAGLTAGASVRAEEITELGTLGLLTDHTRPNGTNFSTVFDEVGKHYANYAENLDGGAATPAQVVEQWMSSQSHREHILNDTYKKLGVGYNYFDEDKSDHRYYWVQLFADKLNAPETVSTANLLTANMTVDTVKKFIELDNEPNTLDNTDYGATIAALGGNDSIKNSNVLVSISGGADNDTIQNSGSFVTVKGGKGNDSINLSGGAKEILIQYSAGDGNDTVTGLNSDDTISIEGGEYTPEIVDNDVVLTVGTDSVKLVGAANLSLNIDSKRSKLYILTEGNDTHLNYIANTTIRALGGDDFVRNYTSNNVSIDAGAGNDEIRNQGNTITVPGGSNVTIDGGDGNDDIYSTGMNASINGGNGNDSIWNSDDQYGKGGDNVTILGGAGDDSLRNDVDNVTIDGGDGDDTIESWDGSNVSIYGGNGNDSICSYSDSATIDAGAGNDTIDNYANSVTIDAGAGNDSIYNVWSENVSIDAGAGNDSIYNMWSENVSIDAGAGNDQISLSSYAKNNLIQYSEGDGNDSIINFNEDNTLQIGGGSGTYSTFTSGNDVIVKVGTGYIKLLDAKYLSTVNINGTDNGADLDLSVTLTESNDTYRNSLDGATIQALGGNDSITNNASFVTLNGGLGDDTINLSSDARENLIQYSAGDGNDLINGFNETDTLSISGGEYTRSTIGNDIVIAVGNDSITLTGAAKLNDFKISAESVIKGKRVKLSEGNDTYINTVEGATIAALGGDDSIESGLEVYFNTNDRSEIMIHRGDRSIDEENYLWWGTVDFSNVSINGGAGNDSIYSYGDNVTLTGGDGNDSIYNGGIRSGNSAVIDAGAGDDTIDNHGDYNISINAGDGNNSITSYAESNITIITGSGNDSIYSHGDSVTIDAGAGNDSIDSSGDSATIDAGAGNDSINSFGDSATIDAGAGNDSITNYAASVSIDAGAGNDSIDSSGDSATIDAGAGNDSIYSYGDSIVIGAGAGNDSIYSHGDSVSIDAGAGNDSIESFRSANSSINGGNGDDTIQNWGDSSNVSIVGGAGNDSIKNGMSWGYEGDNVTVNHYTVASGGNSAVLFGDDGNDTIYNGGSFVTIEAGAGDDSITSGISKIRIADQDNVTLLDSVNGNGDLSEIFGGAGRDTIYNGGSNVTITGGTGDDRISLHSDAKDNVIQYSLGDGNDTITGFNETLTLNILAEGYSSVARGDDIIINVGNGSITLKDARNKPPHIVLGESGSSGGSSGGDGSGGNGNSSGGNSGNGSSGNGSSGNGNSDVGGTSSGYGSNRLNPFLIRQERQSNPTQQPSATPTTPDTPAQSSTNQNVYTGGDQVISNYAGEKIIFGAEYTGAFFDGNNFYFGSTTGVLAVQNATDKFIDLSDGAGNDFIKAYAATTPGIIDGRGLAGFEIFNGSNGSDAIFAGNNGSQLWGGADNLGDFIVGGNGSDIFIAGKNQGADLIFNASANDIVHLNDATVSDIVSAGEHDGTIVISFNTGNIVAVQSSEALSATFRLADGAEYQFNHAAKTWQSTANQNIYSGGDMVISNYAGEKITFAADYTGSAFADGNFYFGSTTGTLIVQNAADKFIDLGDAAGNDFIKAYAATTPGIIDGRGLAGFDVFNGSSGSDAIFAGNGGSQLWGGAGNATDVFVGGEGADIFVVGKNQGADMIFSASANDIVHFNDASLSDIVATSEIDGNISIAFNTGNVITVQSTDDLSARFLFADGSTQRFNHSTKTWQ